MIVSQSFYRLSLVLLCACFLSRCEEDTPIVMPRMDLQADVVDASSNGSQDGGIDLEVVGGEPPYVYAWNTGAREQDLSGLNAGTYVVTVADAASAVTEGSFEIKEPLATPLVIVFTYQDASRYSSMDASVSATVSGGNTPYAYQWSTGAATPHLEGIGAGTYRLTVTDASQPQLVVVDSIAIGQPAFVCGRDSIRDVDGNLYPTVKLGDQCWTAQNLRTRHHPKRSEEALAEVYCNGQNCRLAPGAHYGWETAAMPEKDVCPCEWHLPSVAEWTELNGWLSVDGNGGSGTLPAAKLRGLGSSSGFDALNAGNFGFPLVDGPFAAFWTASDRDDRASYRLLTPSLPILGGGEASKELGLSVRCVQD